MAVRATNQRRHRRLVKPLDTEVPLVQVIRGIFYAQSQRDLLSDFSFFPEEVIFTSLEVGKNVPP